MTLVLVFINPLTLLQEAKIILIVVEYVRAQVKYVIIRNLFPHFNFVWWRGFSDGYNIPLIP